MNLPPRTIDTYRLSKILLLPLCARHCPRGLPLGDYNSGHRPPLFINIHGFWLAPIVAGPYPPHIALTMCIGDLAEDEFLGSLSRLALQTVVARVCCSFTKRLDIQ